MKEQWLEMTTSENQQESFWLEGSMLDREVKWFKRNSDDKCKSYSNIDYKRDWDGGALSRIGFGFLGWASGQNIPFFLREKMGYKIENRKDGLYVMRTGNKGDFLAETTFQTSPICICFLVCNCCFKTQSQCVARLAWIFLSYYFSLLSAGVTGMQIHAGLKMYC